MIDARWTPTWDDFVTFRILYSRNPDASGLQWRIRPVKIRFKEGDRFGADAELVVSESANRFLVNVGVLSHHIDHDELMALSEAECQGILRRAASDILFSHAFGLAMQLGGMAGVALDRAWVAPEPEWAEILVVDSTEPTTTT